MKVRLTKSDGLWTADCPELPGTPPVGRSESLAEAIGQLVLSLHYSRPTWGQFTDLVELPEELCFVVDGTGHHGPFLSREEAQEKHRPSDVFPPPGGFRG